MVIPFNTFKGYFKARRSIDIGVLVETPDQMNAAEDQLVGILRRARQTPPDKPDDFAINRPEQLASTYQQLTGALYGVALGIGFITLLVGGIGIMNIMLVSVRERTREIGVRRALGARKRTIIVQFMLEATVVSALGGALGTAVGLGGAKVVSLVTPLAATVKPGTVVFGVVFAALVGLVFGIWPAARAAQPRPGGGAEAGMIRAASLLRQPAARLGDLRGAPVAHAADAAGHRHRRHHGDDDDGAARGPARQGEQGPLAARRQRLPGRQVAPGHSLRRRRPAQLERASPSGRR